MLIRRFLGRKTASVTIEVTLSICLSILVLFLGIGLFSGNLSTLAGKTGLKNFTHQEKVTNDWGKMSARTEINVAQSQQEVQVVADQGLGWYLTQAQTTIAKYNGRTDLNQAEAEDLAKALMIAKMCGLTTDSTGASIDYVSFYKNNGIKVTQTTNSYKTTISTLNSPTKSLAYNESVNSNDGQLIAVQSITKDIFR